MTTDKSGSEVSPESCFVHAEKLLKSKRSGFLSFFSGSGPQYEDAAEWYVRAANIYKLNKQWREASVAFVKAAECMLNTSSTHDVAHHYVSASTSLKKVDTPGAIELLKKAIKIYTQMGKFSIAAKHMKDVAEMYETQRDLATAITCYQTAADWYLGDDATATANACLLKVAIYSAEMKDYTRAIDIFESIAVSSASNSLLRFSIKEYLFQASICQIARQDLVACNMAFDKYCSIDSSFHDSREFELVKRLIEAVDLKDPDMFSQAVAEYDSFTRLDSWKTSVLLEAKRAIESSSIL